MLLSFFDQVFDRLGKDLLPGRLSSKRRQLEHASDLGPAHSVEKVPNASGRPLTSREKAIDLSINSEGELQGRVALLQILKNRNPAANRLCAKLFDDRRLADAPLGIYTNRLLIDGVLNLLDDLVTTNNLV